MPFVFLLLFALICLQTHWPEPPAWLTYQGTGMLVGTMIVASWLTAWLIARVLCWQLVRHPDQRLSILRRYARWRRHHFIALLTAYLATLYLLGWGRVVFVLLTELLPEWCRNDANVPGAQLALLAPYFIGLIASWERWHSVERTAYLLTHENDAFLSRSAYLLTQIRHQFFIVIPPIFVMTILQILYIVFAGYDQNGYLPVLVMTGLLVAAFLTMPILLRLFLGLKPLPPGPLRERLENTARRLHFGYSNILVWHTRHLFANAMVTGFVPWIRYIILTDRLIEELTPDEIEAVFGHEVGHIKHHHLLFYLAFFLTSVILFSVLWDAAGEWMTGDSIQKALAGVPYMDAGDVNDTMAMLSSFGKLALLGPYMLLFFGYLSRRCERQADLFGAQTVSTDTFIGALEKVADINGIPRDRFSWLHPAIDKRIEFLREMRDHPARVPSFHLSIRLMQWSLYATLGCLLLVLWQFEMLDVWKLLLEF
jgi:Zn-dependent protease with chaperone function